MFNLEITTIIGCKNNCFYCPQDKIVKAYNGKRLMTFEDFKRIMSRVPKNVGINFSGYSEAFLNNESSLMMRYVIDKGYRTALYTTLVGFNENDINVLKGVKFSKVIFHKFKSKLFDATEFKNQIKLFEDNIQKAEGTAIVREIEEGDSVNTWEWSRAGNTVEIIPQKGKFHCPSCGKTFGHNVVIPNGDVYICCQDYGLKHKIGNLFETEYMDLDRQHLTDLSNREDSDIICRKCELFQRDEV